MVYSTIMRKHRVLSIHCPKFQCTQGFLAWNGCLVCLNGMSQRPQRPHTSTCANGSLCAEVDEDVQVCQNFTSFGTAGLVLHTQGRFAHCCSCIATLFETKASWKTAFDMAWETATQKVIKVFCEEPIP